MADVDDDAAALLGALRVAVVASSALLLLRLQIATGTGFGDAEALYATYALHPQPAYLDHPGLIGLVARLIGGGGAPSPRAAHVVTSIAATLLPWVGGFAARAAGAPWRRALLVVIALALAPEIAIGLYALTPDLPLAFAWLGAIGLYAAALRAEPRSFRALASTLGVGALVGVACLSQATGVLLGVAILGASLTRGARARWRTPAPWLAAALACLLVAPLVVYEQRLGWPMLRHRLVATQTHAGISLRNLGALLGGQLAYVTPPFLFAAGLLAVDLWRKRRDDDVSRLLWLATLVPALVLVPLCLWSRVAEPHWLAPMYLALAVHLARSDAVGKRLAKASAITGAVVVALTWAMVKTPLMVRALGSHYHPRYDLVNDLYAWKPGKALLEDAVRGVMTDTHRLPVVIGPHWTVCAQAAAALDGRAPVGCNGPIRDDFDGWLPRAKWIDAPEILYVTDDRFPAIDPAKELPGRSVGAALKIEVRRGGRVVRTIRILRLDKTTGVGLAR